MKKILMGLAATTMSALLLTPTLSQAEVRSPDARTITAAAAVPCFSDVARAIRA